MMQHIFQRLALLLFWIYVAIFPGSTIVVALDRVPGWGGWMGGALLLLQGAVALCWLLGAHEGRGGVAALLIFLLAWAVEHVGVTAGVPFGRYSYTSALQPQLFGTVPLAIPCAWLMVAIGAWQLARSNLQPFKPLNLQTAVLAATLVLLLDLQIETVTTKVNQYWIWQDSGPYYGVPTANFVAWWMVGLGMAWVVAIVLPPTSATTFKPGNLQTFKRSIAAYIPAYLYLLSTLMFTIVNLSHGYIVAGLVGVLVLLAAALAVRPAIARRPLFQGVEQAERAD
jgi:bisanhydrobacterioruberin hydratase